MPVGELLHRMGSRELSEWLAFYQLESEDMTDRERQASLATAAAAGLERRSRRPDP